MAEGLSNYVPSTQGEGQGAAQILSADYQSVTSPLGATLSNMGEKAEAQRKARAKKLEEVRKAAEIEQNVTESPYINDVTDAMLQSARNEYLETGSDEALMKLKKYNNMIEQFGDLYTTRYEDLQKDKDNYVRWDEESGSYVPMELPENFRRLTRRATPEEIEAFASNPDEGMSLLNEQIYSALSENEMRIPPDIYGLAEAALEAKKRTQAFGGADEIDGVLVETTRSFYDDKTLDEVFDKTIDAMTPSQLVASFAVDNNVSPLEAARIAEQEPERIEEYKSGLKTQFKNEYSRDVNVIKTRAARREDDKEEESMFPKVDETFNVTVTDESGYKFGEGEEVRSGGVPTEGTPSQKEMTFEGYKDVKIIDLGLKTSPRVAETEIPVKKGDRTVLVSARPLQIVYRDGDLKVIYMYEDPKRGEQLTAEFDYESKLADTEKTPKSDLASRYGITKEYIDYKINTPKASAPQIDVQDESILEIDPN